MTKARNFFLKLRGSECKQRDLKCRENNEWLKVRELIRNRVKESCIRQLQAGMKGYNLQITFAVNLKLKASFLLLVQSTCTIK